jgi:hypothetical protein
VLAYDSAWLSVLAVRHSISLPWRGLSGEIRFDGVGYRSEGVFFGVSAVPDLSSPSVTLLQPSTWILEDTTTLTETLEGQVLIRDYEVATSSLLTAEELRGLANGTKVKEEQCADHVLNIITHDPFNQMPYNYFFKETNLPLSLLIPNQHGFGLSFLCIHQIVEEEEGNQTETTTSTTDSMNNGTLLTTTMQIACTPANKMSEPIKCFRSEVKRRQRRSPDEGQRVPEYQYGFEGVSSTRPWYGPQNSKWSSPKEDYSNSYYYQGPQGRYSYYGGGPSTPSYLNLR